MFSILGTIVSSVILINGAQGGVILSGGITPKLHSERGIYEGYKIRYNVAGYSILTTRSTLNTIGNFDEKFSFWYADDDYAMSLKANKLRHALIGSASVFHAVEQSHGLFNEEERIKQTTGAKKIFEEKWK